MVFEIPTYLIRFWLTSDSNSSYSIAVLLRNMYVHYESILLTNHI